MPPAHTKACSRIAIVGVGQVGGAAAYALILSGVASELLLVDVKIELRDAQVRDLSDVAYGIGGGTRVRAATHSEAAQCDIVVITAGSKYFLDAIILVVANPVDLLTTLVQELCRLPKFQVFGTGTFLDSVRLRGLLAEKTGVSSSSIQLSVIGVHGDTQVAAWSSATINGVPIDQFLPPEQCNHADLANECKHISEDIFRAKGATPFGIGSVVASICTSILLDKGDVQPISHFQSEHRCCFSLPVVLGRKGIMRTVQLPLSSDEKAHLARSAERLKETLERIKHH
ncbi:b346e62d-5ce0-4d94-bc72-52f0bde53733 [Thermothielavioides terrestris]|uniref:B346e62d-5ce0-4d94-bc72-52f0bde53733 n=1 Tax=Thermothielavioides terrestris TaxID=2587410 RepID=A0A446BT20_9PEZI|nr:b346e62d-5ce0-4d94-bc72-52f0bde53733 [Thermothielavioides terrestris]